MIVDYSTIKSAGIYRQLPKSDIVPLIKEAQIKKVLYPFPVLVQLDHVSSTIVCHSFHRTLVLMFCLTTSIGCFMLSADKVQPSICRCTTCPSSILSLPYCCIPFQFLKHSTYTLTRPAQILPLCSPIGSKCWLYLVLDCLCLRSYFCSNSLLAT
jgi:hypothetical protein